MVDEIHQWEPGTTWEELESYLYEVSLGSIYTFKQIDGKWVASITDPLPPKLRVIGDGDTIAEALEMAVTSMLTLLHDMAQ